MHAPVAFDWKDPLNVANNYTEEELAIAETAESYCQERMLPRVLGNSDSFPVMKRTANATMQRPIGMRTLTGRFSRKWEN